MSEVLVASVVDAYEGYLRSQIAAATACLSAIAKMRSEAASEEPAPEEPAKRTPKRRGATMVIVDRTAETPAKPEQHAAAIADETFEEIVALIVKNGKAGARTGDLASMFGVDQKLLTKRLYRDSEERFPHLPRVQLVGRKWYAAEYAPAPVASAT